MARRLSKKKIKLIISIVSLIVVFVLQATRHADPSSVLGTVAQNQPGLYHVTKFVDGDTIDVDMNGKSETIRFIGVDTPETHKPNTPVQCFGEKAAAFTKMLIGTNNVRLESDPQGTNRDRYDRLLRYIYLPDGTLVNAEIVKQGYGFAVVGFPFTKMEEFKTYENQARESNRGLWGGCEITTESNHLRTNDAGK